MSPDKLSISGKGPAPIAAGAPASSAAPRGFPEMPDLELEENFNSSATEPAPPVAEEDAGLVLFALDEPSALYQPLLNQQPGRRVNWILTFADLMNLLLCCFILLYASSKLDLEKFRLIAQSMSSALSGKTVIYVPVPAEDAPKMMTATQETDMTPRLRGTWMYANQLRATLAAEISQKQLDVEVSGQLIIIHILQNGSFETGSINLNTNFLPTARKIRDALVDVPGDITVAGHADNQPVSGGSFRSNWELSGARAFSVMRELFKDNVLPNERFVMKGYGDTQPRVPNTTQANREKNRRVEIIIDQRGIADTPEIAPRL